MVIYVQSRGLTQDHDYRWLKVDGNHQTPVIPELLNRPIEGTQITPVDLIDSQKFSIVLFRFGNELTLLITGLKAGEDRIDFAGRTIRNSLVIQDRYAYEKRFRNIVIRALTNQLELDLNTAICSGGDYGFTVDLAAITALQNLEKLQFGEAESHLDKLAKNSPERRQDLALELSQNSLPNRQGLLIVVTSFKTDAVLKKINVWRGLSSRIESEDWQVFNERPQANPTELNSTTVANQTPEKKGGLIFLLLLLLLIAIAILILFYLRTQVSPQPRPEILIPTPAIQGTPNPTPTQPEPWPTTTPEIPIETPKTPATQGETTAPPKAVSTPENVPEKPLETFPINAENSGEE
jgi:hypothetical protein